MTIHKQKSKQEHLDELKTGLKGWMPSEGNAETMLAASAEAMEELDKTKHQVGNALNIQTAETVDDLRTFGEFVEEYPENSDSFETYKTKVLNKFQQLSVSGRPDEILDYMSRLLDIEKSAIEIQNVENDPSFKLIIPVQVLQNSELPEGALGDLLSNICAATYNGVVPVLGSLEYISETEYNNNNFDTSDAYATFDSNGDLTSGGTYGTAYQ